MFSQANVGALMFPVEDQSKDAHLEIWDALNINQSSRVCGVEKLKGLSIDSDAL